MANTDLYANRFVSTIGRIGRIGRDAFVLRGGVVRTTAAIGCAGAVLSACDAHDPRSTLQLHLMAKPASGIEAVQLYVGSIAVHVAAKADVSATPGDSALQGDGLWHTLAVGRTLDLSKSKELADAVAVGSLRLPDGWIDQVRIAIQTPATALAAGKTCSLVLAKLPKAGIDVTQAFRPFATGHVLQHAVWLDLRLDLSLGKVGECWALSPVLELRRYTTQGKDVAIQ